MGPKAHYHSLDQRGALGRFLMINYFGDGETTLLTETGRLVKGLKPTTLDKNVYRLHYRWNKFPGSAGLNARVFTSPYRSLVLPDGKDAWLRVDDGFIQSDAPFDCIPRDDIEYPADKDTGNWEEKVNEYDALDTFEPTDDP
eukprot:2959023-Amphidinium_carterae.1